VKGFQGRGEKILSKGINTVIVSIAVHHNGGEEIVGLIGELPFFDFIDRKDVGMGA
jgi:hypothetical protein